MMIAKGSRFRSRNILLNLSPVSTLNLCNETYAIYNHLSEKLYLALYIKTHKKGKFPSQNMMEEKGHEWETFFLALNISMKTEHSAFL